MNFFNFKDGKDFLNKTKMTHEEAIEFLERELEKRGGESCDSLS